MLRTFVCVFWILRLQVGQRVVSCCVNQGVWIVGASAKKLDGQLINKLSNRGGCLRRRGVARQECDGGNFQVRQIPSSATQSERRPTQTFLLHKQDFK